MITSLDAGMACPIIVNKGLLGFTTPIGEGLSEDRLNASDIKGVAFSLQQNLMPISGFPEWYPFGVGGLLPGGR